MHARFGAAFAAAFMGFLIVSSGESVFSQPPAGKGKDFKGGFGPPGGQTRKLVKEFDKNGDGWLNQEERDAGPRVGQEGRLGGKGFGGKGFGGKGGFGKGGEARQARAEGDARRGEELSERQAVRLRVLRTLFLDFENKDWEAGAAGLPRHRRRGARDADRGRQEVPERRRPLPRHVVLHGRRPTGSKRSLNVSLDLADKKQRLYGYKTLNLLNSHEDPSFMSTVLYSHIARQYIPAPEGQLREGGHQRRELGRLHATCSSSTRCSSQENYKTDEGHAVEGARQPRRPRRAGVPRRRTSTDYKRIFEIKGERRRRRRGRRSSTCARC